MDVLKTWFTPHKPPPPQGGCSPKIFLYIILAAKWLVRHSNTRTSPIFSSFYPSSMAHIDCATAYNKQSFSCLLQYNSSLLAGAQANERNVVFGLLHQTLFEVVGVIPHRLSVLSIEEGWRQQQRQRPSRLFWGQNLFIKFLAALADLPRSIWKKMLNASFSFKSTNGEFE